MRMDRNESYMSSIRSVMVTGRRGTGTADGSCCARSRSMAVEGTQSNHHMGINPEELKKLSTEEVYRLTVSWRQGTDQHTAASWELLTRQEEENRKLYRITFWTFIAAVAAPHRWYNHHAIRTLPIISAFATLPPSPSCGSLYRLTFTHRKDTVHSMDDPYQSWFGFAVVSVGLLLGMVVLIWVVW